MPHMLLKDVGVSIPIYNSQGRSLKKTIMGMASAGRIGLTEKGVTVVQSLNNINLTVKSKERVGIIGSNGAGKSTLLRVLAKVYAPTSGTAEIEGTIGSLIGISLGIDSEATGLENIYMRAALLGVPKSFVDENLNDIVTFAELDDFIHMPVRTYSSGMHMRLAFAVSTMISPEILLMDEWLSVGDKSFNHKAEKRLNSLIECSNILIIASHSRSLIENCCTRAIWLDKGSIKLDGTPKEVCDAYFGK